MTERHFGWVDYCLNGGLCVLFLVIGLVPACTGGKQNTPAEYLRGNKRLSLIPVALSLSVSYVSGLAFMGLPAEIYFFGIHFILTCVGASAGAVLSSFTFLPVMYHTQTSSVNMLIFAGIVIVSPALFIKTVSNIPTWVSMIVIGAISTFYTTMGGLKAVIWTDALQAAIIYIGMLVVLIQGTLNIGSIGKTFQLYSEGGRVNFNFIPSPLKRYDVWAMTVLKFPSWAMNYGSNQLAVQRYTSISTFERARRCLLLQIPCSFLFYTSAALMGIVAYSYYANLGCDPFAAGYIHNINQIIPYMVMEIMTLPGMPGLFFAGILAGGFSNISSSLMAIAQMLWEDMLIHEFRGLKDTHKAYVIKTLVLASGVVSTCMAFILMEVRGTLLQMATMVRSSIDVPLGVIFIIAVAWPPANSKAVLLGSLIASGVITWIAQGALYYKYPHQFLPLTTDGCHSNMTSFNVTLNYMTTTNTTMGQSVQHGEDPSWMDVYKISHTWYSPLGYTIGIVATILLSFIPGFKTKDKIDERYIVPCLRSFFRSYLVQNHPVRSDEVHKDETVNAIHESGDI